MQDDVSGNIFAGQSNAHENRKNGVENLNVYAKLKRIIWLKEGRALDERTVQVVSNIEGVKSSKANLASSTLSVEYDASKVTIDNIKSAIYKVGYKFVGRTPFQRIKRRK